MIEMLMKEPLLGVASLILAVAVFLLVRFPLCWWIRPIQETELIQWDLDDNRRRSLRRDSSLFAKLEPWIVGLSNGMDRSLPIADLDSVAVSKLSPREKMLRSTLGTRDSVVLGIRTGVIPGAGSAGEYVATMLVVSVGVAISCALFFFGMQLSIRFLLGTILFAALAFRLQLVHLDKQIRSRQSQIRRLLPHGMEILSMTMSAGGTFQTGVEDVIRDFPEHPLAKEFDRLIRDLQRGVGMHEALRNVAKRVRIEEFDDVLRTMTISHEHGAPASEFFKRGAKQLRTKHLRAMEVAVGKAEAKMPLPTMIITVACMIIAIAPFVVGALESGIMDMFGK
jgi:Flp pilus assembly protein TadB